MVFWYNKDLCQKAGVDPTQIKQWEDFMEAVKKIKAAGITPIAAGGKDKWPLAFLPRPSHDAHPRQGRLASSL